MKCDTCGKETFDNFPTCKFCVLESLKKKEGRFRPVTIEGEVERIRKKTTEDMADWLKKNVCDLPTPDDKTYVKVKDVKDLIEEAKEKVKKGELK